MIASSALVMAALTVTGVYMKNQSSLQQNDGYSIDFSDLEKNVNEEVTDQLGGLTENNPLNGEDLLGGSDGMEEDLAGMQEADLDYDPMAEVDSDRIEIPGLTDQEKVPEGAEGSGGQKPSADVWKKENDGGLGQGNSGDKQIGDQGENGDGALSAERTEEGAGQELVQGDQESGLGGQLVQGEQSGQEPDQLAQDGQGLPDSGLQYSERLQYSETQGLVRPTMGEVLMHYSMDGSIYFATLDQYKYNPAVMLRATEGDSVLACAEGQVISIYEDPEIGTALILDLGNGYQATYGQLKNLTVSMGSCVNSGDILGCVAAPTKYFSVEGPNLYFRLTKDSAPVNPEQLFR